MKKPVLISTLITLILSLNGAYASLYYSVTDLGDLGGGISYGMAVNEQGQVAGYSLDSNGYERAFVWDSLTGMQNLGTLGGESSIPYAINSHGQIVGKSKDETGLSMAFLWNPSGGMTHLGVLGDTHISSYAYSINDQGQVVGGSYDDATNANIPFIWDADKGMKVLDFVTTDSIILSGEAFGRGINNQGDVISHRVNPYQNGVLTLSNGISQLIPTTDGNRGYSFPQAINDTGQIVGTSNYHAFLWNQTTGFVDLGFLRDDDDFSGAQSINNEGVIVGMSFEFYKDYDDSLAFIYRDGQMFDLNNFIDPSTGWQLTRALGITDSGFIVGTAVNPEGYRHAFLLTPTPEPTTLCLLAFGSLYLVRRKIR